MTKHTVIIANDTVEADKFCEWLISQGHEASIGDSTGNYVDGEWTSANPDANETMNTLWNQYCNS